MLSFYKQPAQFFVPTPSSVPNPVPIPIDNIPQPIGRFGIYRPPLVAPTPPLEDKVLNSLERAKKRIIPELVNKNIFV